MRAPLRPPNPGLTQHSSPRDFSLGARPQAVQLEPASRWTPINQIAITSIVAAGPFHMPHGRANVQYKAKCAVKPRRFSHRVSSHDVTSDCDMAVVFIRKLRVESRSIEYLERAALARRVCTSLLSHIHVSQKL